MAIDPVRLFWRDFNGYCAANILYVDSNTTTEAVLALTSALASLSTCELYAVRREVTLLGPTTEVGDTGDYATQRDVVRLRFRTSELARADLEFPGPAAGIFLEDRQTVNPDNTAVVTALAALVLTAKTASAASFTSLMAGWRSYFPFR